MDGDGEWGMGERVNGRRTLIASWPFLLPLGCLMMGYRAARDATPPELPS